MHVIGGVSISDSKPVRIMGILNVSPESFFKKSIKTTSYEIKQTAKRMEEEGADFIDIGGMSTAPYNNTFINETEEMRRVINAIKAIREISNIPLSIDTVRAAVAKAALEEGANIVNDVSGLRHDKEMKKVIANHSASVIICAFSLTPIRGYNISRITSKILKKNIDFAVKAGIDPCKIVLDPAIGFFRDKGRGELYTKINADWVQRDLITLRNLKTIKGDFPLLVSVSNKSFIGRLLNKPDPSDRLAGSIALEAMAILKGANVIRTHNVKGTKRTITLLEKFCKQTKAYNTF